MSDPTPPSGSQEHEHVREELSAFLDGQLDSSLRGLVEHHLASCEDCQLELESLRKTVALLSSLPAVQSSRSFAIRPAQAQRINRQTVWLYWTKAASSIAAALLIIFVGVDLFATAPGAEPLATMTANAPADSAATYSARSLNSGSAPIPPAAPAAAPAPASAGKAASAPERERATAQVDSGRAERSADTVQAPAAANPPPPRSGEPTIRLLELLAIGLFLGSGMAVLIIRRQKIW